MRLPATIEWKENQSLPVLTHNFSGTLAASVSWESVKLADESIQYQLKFSDIDNGGSTDPIAILDNVYSFRMAFFLDFNLYRRIHQFGFLFRLILIVTGTTKIVTVGTTASFPSSPAQYSYTGRDFTNGIPDLMVEPNILWMNFRYFTFNPVDAYYLFRGGSEISK